MKRSTLKTGEKSRERGSTFKAERRPLRRAETKRRRRAISEASRAQRAAVSDHGCLVCGCTPVHPAHLIPKSLCSDLDGDAKAVVPLCPECHRAYDGGDPFFDLLPYLEPRFRVELAEAVERFGLLRTLERVTNCRWAPVREGSR